MVTFLLMFISALIPLGRAWELSGSISLLIVIFIFFMTVILKSGVGGWYDLEF